MTEEEKKAIDLLKHCQNTYIEDTKVDKLLLTTKEAEIILNLIDKQQQEIDQLKNAEEYSKLGKEELLDTIHKQQKEIEALKEHNGELAKFILNLNPKLINIDKNELVIDKNNFAKFKIE